MTYMTATIVKQGRHWFTIGTVYFPGDRTTETITRRFATRAAAEMEAEKLDGILMEQAEEYNRRVDAARAYLAARALRTKEKDDAQLALAL